MGRFKVVDRDLVRLAARVAFHVPIVLSAIERKEGGEVNDAFVGAKSGAMDVEGFWEPKGIDHKSTGDMGQGVNL